MYRILFHESEADQPEPFKDEIPSLQEAYLLALSYAHVEVEYPHQYVSVESYMEPMDDMPGVGDGILIMEINKIQGHVVVSIEFAATDVL